MSTKKPVVQKPTKAPVKTVAEKQVAKKVEKPITVLSTKPAAKQPAKNVKSVKELNEKANTAPAAKAISKKPLTPAVNKAVVTAKPVKAPVAKQVTTASVNDKVTMASLNKTTPVAKPVSPNKISFKDLMSNMTASMGNSYIPGQAR